eukprot:1162075-Pelagomonas_calceolata.AAC.18
MLPVALGLVRGTAVSSWKGLCACKLVLQLRVWPGDRGWPPVRGLLMKKQSINAKAAAIILRQQENNSPKEAG